MRSPPRTSTPIRHANIPSYTSWTRPHSAANPSNNSQHHPMYIYTSHPQPRPRFPTMPSESQEPSRTGSGVHSFPAQRSRGSRRPKTLKPGMRRLFRGRWAATGWRGGDLRQQHPLHQMALWLSGGPEVRRPQEGPLRGERGRKGILALPSRVLHQQELVCARKPVWQTRLSQQKTRA
jgi:hypothetical protein